MKDPLAPATPESMSLLAQALLATSIGSTPTLARAQEREAWTYAILSYARRQRLRPPGEEVQHSRIPRG